MSEAHKRSYRHPKYKTAYRVKNWPLCAAPHKGQLLSVFLDVVVPVFGIVAIGYTVGPRLKLEARTLSRVAYYVFVPAFAFNVISTADVPLASALRMTSYICTIHVLFAVLGWSVAKLLGRSREIVAAFVMLSVFGNVGNFGLALINFRLGFGKCGCGTWRRPARAPCRCLLSARVGLSCDS